MKCPKCGGRVSIKDNFCYACGAEISEEEKEKYRQKREERKKKRESEVPPIDFSIFGMPPPEGNGPYAPPPPMGGMGGRPMKWYHFLINFALFAYPALNVLNAFSYLAGFAYLNEFGEIVTYETYQQFPSLFLLDIAYAMLLLGVAAFGILTRFSLAKLKKRSPRMLLIFFGVSAGVNLLYQLVAGFITGQIANPILPASIFMAFLIQVIFIIFNHTYFSKRRDLFTIE